MSLLEPGATVSRGRYVVQRLLRQGTVKAVYLVLDTRIQREVALAVVDRDRLTPSGMPESEWEAQVLGKLGDHPNVVTVFDRWEEDGAALIASQYLPGGDLEGLLERAGDTPAGIGLLEVLRLTEEVARGLAHVHARGIVHRDVQPRNILLDFWLTAYIGDFDLAVAVEDQDNGDLASRTTVGYMAPEIARGELVDGRADLYSLGVVAYEMLAGAPPFAGWNAQDILRRHRETAPAPLSWLDPVVPPRLVDLVMRLVSNEPSDRPASAKRVADELAAIRANLRRGGHEDLRTLILQGEHESLEFKSSFRAPVGPGGSWEELTKANKAEIVGKLERAVTAAIAALLNTGGGSLLIGVSDGGEILGIEPDLRTLKTKPSIDGWRLAFDAALSRDIGADSVACVSLKLVDVDRRIVAVVTCDKRDHPTWHRGDLIVRRGASSMPLSAQEAVAFARDRWA